MNWKVSLDKVSMVILLMLSMVMGLNGLSYLLYNNMNVVEMNLILLSSCSISFTLVFDYISLFFLSVVFLISGSVLYYSGSYMAADKSYDRFMWLVLLFVGSMNFMILSPNLISILLGWDGLGLVSYALVIYYQNSKSSAAGMLTVLSNRVGDVAILLSIGLMSKEGSWNFFCLGEYLDEMNILEKWLIMIAATTKSAQIPFSAWLPAAMAAPTPVSALVHSSTLVTAGVYLMIRFYSALDGTNVKLYLLIISCLTMMMSGMAANFEFDLKKIIALSTLSQLGLMLSTLCLGLKLLTFFHLLTHALFKALLFMCAGQVIHNMKNYQDIRNMGGLVYSMPLTISYMTLSNLALCGFPFLAGFYSKDVILEMVYMNNVNFLIFLIFLVATGLTAMYTFRLIFFSLVGEYNCLVYNNESDKDSVMNNSMIMLGLGTIMGGSGLSWLLFPESYMVCLDMKMKLLTLYIVLVGALMGYILNLFNLNYNLVKKNFYSVMYFVGSMWNLSSLSMMSNKPVLLKSKNFLNLGDKGWYEMFGGQGLSFLFSKGFILLNFMQINTVKLFMKLFLVGVILVMISV
uniref:NADH-ubiquinone oxidoreductase chain 5 n=1 Tax=Pyrhila pisum TaxID=1550678 RepID=A0A165TXD4_PYRPS|nr:NADH dehydrogenase subunit 5 [Pyrhila pisum]AMY96229.1 NADH dehydrogenase subunit 5 [Pyrhila pisum]